MQLKSYIKNISRMIFSLNASLVASKSEICGRLLEMFLNLVILTNVPQDQGSHIVPVARFEAFGAVKLSRLESFCALTPYGQTGRF